MVEGSFREGLKHLSNNTRGERLLPTRFCTRFVEEAILKSAREFPRKAGKQTGGSPQSHEEAWGDWSRPEGSERLVGEAGSEDRSLSMEDLV